MDTKTKILETARTLFSKYGYNAVSIADIAEELQISKGNLTYHFKRKEDIMQAILDLMQPRFPEKIPTNLLELHDYFTHLQNVTQDNAFYFRNYTQVSELSERQRQKQKQAFHIHKTVMRQAISSLMDEGLIRRELTSLQYEALTDNLFMLAVYWCSFQEICEDTLQSTSFTIKAWDMIIPYFTEKGQQQYYENFSSL